MQGNSKWIGDYYSQWIGEAKAELEELSENEILAMDTSKFVASYSGKAKLPLIMKDTERTITTKKISRVSVARDDSDLILRRWTMIRISYPIKQTEKIEEAMKRCADGEPGFLGQYRNGWVEIEFSDDENDTAPLWYYAPGRRTPEERQNRAIRDLEETINRRNGEIQFWNENFEPRLASYVDDLKKALIQDREQRAQENRSKSETKNKDKEDDSDWDDDDDRHERTPNDDRSDTLNPNNPASDDARDNRADQLNPNNPRYQGD